MTLSASCASGLLPSPLLAWGPVYGRFLDFLPGWSLLTGAVAVTAWLALRRFQPRLEGEPAGRGERGVRHLYAPLDLRRDWRWLVPACAGLLLVTDWQGFTNGFFRWDDFAFIQDAREQLPLTTLLNQYHNDHSLPLFRLWVSGLVAWGGPAATADQLARLFNAVNYLTCLGVLSAGAALLAACGARRITAICFCLFAWFWPGWGEFTTGFYTLIVYPQTLAAGLLACALVVAYLRGGPAGWMGAGLACALISAGLDVSGVWVFFALAGFAWALGGWSNPAVRRFAPWLLLAFGLAAYYHLVWFHHPYSAREFVQNPFGQDVNHSLATNLTTHFWRLPLATASGLGGTLLSAVTPAFIGLLAPQFYGQALRSAPVYAMELLALGAVAWAGWRGAARLTAANRRLLLAFALPVAVLIGMLVVARVQSLDLPASFWPTKYICLPQVWVVLAAVFLLDRIALVTPAAAQRAARWIAAAVIAGAWLCASFWHLERALAIDPGWRPSGRQGNTAAAALRRADFATFQRDIEELARRTGRRQLAVPPPHGIYWSHPYLECGTNPVRGATYLFTDLLAIAPATGITLQESPPAEIPADTLQAIAAIPTLRPVFDPAPPR